MEVLDFSGANSYPSSWLTLLPRHSDILTSRIVLRGRGARATARRDAGATKNCMDMVGQSDWHRQNS